MANQIASAALQYSKWLSRYICWVWAIYRFAVLVATVLQPAAAEHLANTVAGMDTIMLVNEGTYLVNSLGEKWIYSDRYVLKWFKGEGWNSLVSKVIGKAKEAEEEKKEENTTENG